MTESKGRKNPGRRKKATSTEETPGRAIMPDGFQNLKRPRTRADCVNGPRPCPWVSCKFHLYLDVNEKTGTIKFNFPDLEVWELKETCALDLADKQESSFDDIAQVLNLTKERVRQLVGSATRRLHDAIDPSGCKGDISNISDETLRVR